MPRGYEKTVSPRISISPASGSSSPAIARSSVVLPQPLGPSSTTNSPGFTSSETSSIARVFEPSSRRKVFASPRTETIGFGASVIRDGAAPRREKIGARPRRLVSASTVTTTLPETRTSMTDNAAISEKKPSL